jgi:hypothetical protein
MDMPGLGLFGGESHKQTTRGEIDKVLGAAGIHGEAANKIVRDLSFRNQTGLGSKNFVAAAGWEKKLYESIQHHKTAGDKTSTQGIDKMVKAAQDMVSGVNQLKSTLPQQSRKNGG